MSLTKPIYTAPKLIELLEKQHQQQGKSDLFKKGTFTIQWRAKVGSFPAPDVETIISAAEPCGAWRPVASNSNSTTSIWKAKENHPSPENCPEEKSRPEDKRNVGDNWQYFQKLPLNGYIPASGIRGVVRAWAKNRFHLDSKMEKRMEELLGYQDNDIIKAGKIQFLDAWPQEPTQLSLDIVNPQEKFQIFHQGQSTPLSLYTLGNGEDKVSVTVAIRGVYPHANSDDVEEVWGWVVQALSFYGIGSRTASGYGGISYSETVPPQPNPSHKVKEFHFQLYGQGNAGPDGETMELRPTHWRGWLRSWILRFLLGVMSLENAQKTLAELLGIIEPKSRQGLLRLSMLKGKSWKEESASSPDFYCWQGKLILSVPQQDEEILTKIILPIISFAVMVGGVGRGSRRPLHVFWMKTKNSDREASRGTYLRLKHEVASKIKLVGLSPKPDTWKLAYKRWQEAVQTKWSDRYGSGGSNLNAEVFSPETCAVYLVPGPAEEPVRWEDLEWNYRNTEDTRGEGMDLIYQPKYKRNENVGGKAGDGGSAYCSWVSIKRVNIPNRREETDCQEIVCLFMGEVNPDSSRERSPHLRSQFLKDLAKIPGSVHLFGVQPPLE